MVEANCIHTDCSKGSTHIVFEDEGAALDICGKLRQGIGRISLAIKERLICALGGICIEDIRLSRSEEGAAENHIVLTWKEGLLKHAEDRFNSPSITGVGESFIAWFEEIFRGILNGVVEGGGMSGTVSALGHSRASRTFDEGSGLSAFPVR